jgi:hypothetical protein
MVEQMKVQKGDGEMKPEEQNLPYEELKRRFFEKVDNYFLETGGRPKPKVAVVTIPVSEKDAAVIAANRESLWISARREDGVSVLMKPQGNPAEVTVRVDLVSGVDEEGRPVWSKVVHEYNPFALKG